jgi:hypothetical protein
LHCDARSIDMPYPLVDGPSGPVAYLDIDDTGLVEAGYGPEA